MLLDPLLVPGSMLYSTNCDSGKHWQNYSTCWGKGIFSPMRWHRQCFLVNVCIAVIVLSCYHFVTVTVGTPTSNPENNAEIQQPNVSAGVYVPPSLRKQQQASSLRKQQAYKTKKVPDITSQQAFPSLQPSVQNKDSRYLSCIVNNFLLLLYCYGLPQHVTVACAKMSSHNLIAIKQYFILCSWWMISVMMFRSIFCYVMPNGQISSYATPGIYWLCNTETLFVKSGPKYLWHV